MHNQVEQIQIEFKEKKFDMEAEDNLIRDFEKETKTYLDREDQIEHEDKENELEL